MGHKTSGTPAAVESRPANVGRPADGKSPSRARAPKHGDTAFPAGKKRTPAHARPKAPLAISAPDAARSILPLFPIEQVTDAQLARYGRLIYEKTGIRVWPQKKMLLSNRLRRRLQGTGLESFDAYYRHLKSLNPDHPEWNEFYQEITTHESYLFRDENQWDWFSNAFLAEHAAATRASREPRRLRVWSAACSTGEEPYTIACCVAASLPNLHAWHVDVLGTDIAVGELQRARQAVYSPRAMRLVSEEHRHFFRKAEDSEDWSPRPILQHMVRFCQHNLMHRMKERPFDIVFLKNVLIYFDRESKQKALDNVVPLIRPGGLLVAGAAEGVAGLLGDFKRLEPWLFQRPPASSAESSGSRVLRDIRHRSRRSSSARTS